MKKKGLTLLEIIVAAVILSLVMAGLTGIFVSGKRWLQHSRLKMTGGELGKYFLDPFAMAVRQDQWDDSIGAKGDYTNRLSITSPPASETKTLNGKVYTASYDIDSIPALTDDAYKQARKVTLTITWDEQG